MKIDASGICSDYGELKPKIKQDKTKCTCIISGYGQTTNFCAVHKNMTEPLQKAYENGYQFHKEIVAMEIKKLLNRLGIK